jgi:hypothetical protein
MKVLLPFLAALALTLPTRAVISLGGGSTTGVWTFDGWPSSNDWSSFSISGGSSDVITAVALDVKVQAVSAAQVNAPLPADIGSPPSVLAIAVWSSSGHYIQTRPAGNAATLLMATLQNDRGRQAYSVEVSFEFAARVLSTEQLGVRLYYSLSGEQNTWQFISEFSTATNVSLTLDLNSNPWNEGTRLYLLWADDNGSSVDTAFAIDNFSAVVWDDPVPIIITNQPQDVVVAERGTAQFSVAATGSPQHFTWYRDNFPLPGNNQPSLVLTNVAYPDDDGAEFKVVIDNALGSAISTVATLTVLPDTVPPVLVSAVGEIAADTITLRFSEVLNSNTVNEANFVLFETGTDPQMSPYVTFLVTLSNGTNVTLLTDAREANKNYSVAITDIQDASSQKNPVNPNPAVAPLRQVFRLIGFDIDNDWKYDINNGDRSGTGWERLDYDDSAWPFGPAALGFDALANAVPIRSQLPYSGNGVTTYFRKRFIFPASANGTVLRLRDVVDDGAVYYLNGQEVFRHRMPLGIVNYDTRAISAPDPTPIEGPFFLPVTNLLAGENVLAVEVHQQGAASGDVVMAAELTAEIMSYCLCGPQILSHPQSRTLAEGEPVTLRVIAEGAVPLTYQWYKDGSTLPGRRYALLTIDSATPADAGAYYVVVSNSLASLTSLVATLHIGDPIELPIFLSAHGAANLTNISLYFSSVLQTASVQNVAHYDVRPSQGGPPLTVLSAMLTNGATNVVLTTSPRLPCEDYVVTITNIIDRAVPPNHATPYSRPLISDVPAPVRLTISRNPSNGKITVQSVGCPGVLQQSTTLQSTGTQWTNVPGNPNPHTFTPVPVQGLFFRIVR